MGKLNLKVKFVNSRVVNTKKGSKNVTELKGDFAGKTLKVSFWDRSFPDLKGKEVVISSDKLPQPEDNGYGLQVTAPDDTVVTDIDGVVISGSAGGSKRPSSSPAPAGEFSPRRAAITKEEAVAKIKALGNMQYICVLTAQKLCKEAGIESEAVISTHALSLFISAERAGYASAFDVQKEEEAPEVVEEPEVVATPQKKAVKKVATVEDDEIPF
jgi:hypothetical protein